MNKLILIALSLSVSALLAGCGAKGPLMLPQKAAPIEVPADVPAETVPEAPAPPADETTTIPADQQAEEAVEDPVPPAEND